MADGVVKIEEIQLPRILLRRLIDGESSGASLTMFEMKVAVVSGGKERIVGSSRLSSHSKFQMSPKHTLHLHARLEIPVRSDKVHLALSYGNTRYEICNMIAKGMRATHKAGMRTEESIDRVLALIGPKFIGPQPIPVYIPRPRR